MREDVKSDMGSANIVFLNKILPILYKYKTFKDCRFFCIESLGSEAAKFFDANCGFDWFITFPNGLCRGMAVRCQKAVKGGYRPHTFTIRKNRPNGTMTEFEKRAVAIKEGGVFPFYTLQAYLKGDWDSELDYMAIIRTESLFNNIPKDATSLIAKNGGEGFIPVYWNKLKEAGIKMVVWENNELV